MRLFYFLGRMICYTFAIALPTVIVTSIIISFGYYLGTSFVIGSYEEITIDLIKWVPWTLLIAMSIFLIQFGLFTPIKIPAFFQSLRDINSNFDGDKLNPDIGDKELNDLYNSFVYLPLFNWVSAVFYSILSCAILVGLIYFDYLYSGTFTAKKIEVVFRILSITGTSVIILVAIAVYLLSDIVTAHERATCYNELRRRNINIPPKAIIGIRIKFLFFVILMIVTLLTFGALIERGRFYGEADLTPIVVYFLTSVTAGIVLIYANINSILTILTDLTRVAKEIAAGRGVSFEVLPLDREFASIEYTVMEMEKEIDEYRRNLELKVEERTSELQNALSDLRERDELIQKQLNIAGAIQRGILPSNVDNWNELNFAVRYYAMEKIGGDFYDIMKLSDNKLIIFIADVSGHGIPAALVTAMAKISFNNACRQFDSPRKIFQQVNQDIIDQVKTQDYLTCFFIVIDEEYNITYSNASHQKCIILRKEKSEIELLDTNGLFIGAIDEARETYEEKHTKLSYGDRIILYTDGISEASNEDRQEYSSERLQDLILKNNHLPIEEFADQIIDDVRNHVGTSPIVDDITLIVIEVIQDKTINIIKNVKKQIAEDKYSEAIESLDRALTVYPDDVNLIYNLAKCHFRLNNYQLTTDFIERYIDNDKNNKFAYYIGGAAYFQIENTEKAIEFLEEAVTLDPNFVNALFALAMAYKKKNMIEEAIIFLNKVVNIDEDNRRALVELNKLKQDE
ncbi:MAG: SpoIIE family protein phosphatase [Spirochaetota bacterium]|nr:SpoIIE family protein phosphatase [Spirochaetota bacterium]